MSESAAESILRKLVTEASTFGGGFVDVWTNGFQLDVTINVTDDEEAYLRELLPPTQPGGGTGE